MPLSVSLTLVFSAFPITQLDCVILLYLEDSVVGLRDLMIYIEYSVVGLRDITIY